MLKHEKRTTFQQPIKTEKEGSYLLIKAPTFIFCFCFRAGQRWMIDRRPAANHIVRSLDFSCCCRIRSGLLTTGQTKDDLKLTWSLSVNRSFCAHLIQKDPVQIFWGCFLLLLQTPILIFSKCCHVSRQLLVLILFILLF